MHLDIVLYRELKLNCCDDCKQYVGSTLLSRLAAFNFDRIEIPFFQLSTQYRFNGNPFHEADIDSRTISIATIRTIRKMIVAFSKSSRSILNRSYQSLHIMSRLNCFFCALLLLIIIIHKLINLLFITTRTHDRYDRIYKFHKINFYFFFYHIKLYKFYFHIKIIKVFKFIFMYPCNLRMFNFSGECLIVSF